MFKNFLQSFILVVILVLVIPFSYAGVPELVLAQKKAVVTILIMEDDKQIATGSGSLIDSTGVIATNYHVIAPWLGSKTKTVLAKMENGAFLVVERLVGVDQKNDIALIKVLGRELPAVKTSQNPKAIQGDDVVVIGSPLGLETTISTGIISGIRGEDEFIQITAPISPGSSGSPVFNMNGDVIGIAAMLVQGAQNLNFAIPIKYVNLIMNNPGHYAYKQESLELQSQTSEKLLPTHKGIVISVLDSGGYTYIEYEENSIRSWVAVVETSVKAGDHIEFPDSPPMLNFQSKTLDRTFEKIIFAPGLAITNDDVTEEAIIRRNAEAVSDLIENGKIDEAIAVATDLMRTYPDAGWPYFFRGLAHMDNEPKDKPFVVDGVEPTKDEQDLLNRYTSKYVAAIGDFTKALQFNPDKDLFYDKIGECYYNIGNYIDSIAFYAKAIKINPQNSTYHSWIGLNLFDLGQYLDSIPYFATAIKLDPKNSYNYKMRGKAQYMLDNKNSSLRDFAQAISLDPREYIYEVKELFQKTKAYKDGIDFYNKIGSFKVAGYYGDRGYFYLKVKNYKNALSDYSKAIELSNGGAFYFLKRAEVYKSMKRNDLERNDLVSACNKSKYFCDNLKEHDKDRSRGDKWSYFVTASDDTKFYYNTEDIKRNKAGVVRVWTRNEEKEDTVTIMPETFPEEKLSHVLYLEEINCKNKEFRKIATINSGVNGSSRRYDEPKADFISISPDSIIDVLFKRVCVNGK